MKYRLFPLSYNIDYLNKKYGVFHEARIKRYNRTDSILIANGTLFKTIDDPRVSFSNMIILEDP